MKDISDELTTIGSSLTSELAVITFNMFASLFAT